MLMQVEKENSIEFYVKEAITGNWSTRQLERQINFMYRITMYDLSDTCRFFPFKYCIVFISPEPAEIIMVLSFVFLRFVKTEKHIDALFLRSIFC
jgi:hypothetical protein